MKIEFNSCFMRRIWYSFLINFIRLRPCCCQTGTTRNNGQKYWSCSLVCISEATGVRRGQLGLISIVNKINKSIRYTNMEVDRWTKMKFIISYLSKTFFCFWSMKRISRRVKAQDVSLIKCFIYFFVKSWPYMPAKRSF